MILYLKLYIQIASSSNRYTMEIVGIKVLSGFLFFFDALLFGFVPFCIFWHCLSSKARTQIFGQSQLIQCLHSIASGVLIATCLLHLLPESIENVQNALVFRQGVAGQQEVLRKNISKVDPIEGDEKEKDNDKNPYPIAELMVALGFLVIYMIDTTIKSAQNHKYVNHGIKYSRLKTREDDDDETEIYVQKIKQSVTNSKSHERKSQVKENKRTSHISKSDTDSEDMRYNQTENASNSSQLKQFSDDGQPEESGSVRTAALVLALCIHGFFDGVMLGLQTSTSVLYSLMLALLLHKSFVATSLSLTLLKNYSPGTSQLRVFIYVFMFASVAPIGLAASAAFFHSSLFNSNGDEDVSLTPGCIQAFAVGTFLYVTFTETTGRHGEQRTMKYEIISHVCLVLGFSFMALIRMAVNA